MFAVIKYLSLQACKWPYAWNINNYLKFCLFYQNQPFLCMCIYITNITLLKRLRNYLEHLMLYINQDWHFFNKHAVVLLYNTTCKKFYYIIYLAQIFFKIKAILLYEITEIPYMCVIQCFIFITLWKINVKINKIISVGLKYINTQTVLHYDLWRLNQSPLVMIKQRISNFFIKYKWFSFFLSLHKC